MANYENSNTEKGIKPYTTNVDVSSNVSGSGVVIGSNIRIEGGINVTTVIQEIKSFGLNFLPPDYFEIYKSSQKDLDQWKNGFPFKLHNIMDGLHFQRTDLLKEIITKLEDNNEDHALLLLGRSGTSKTNLLREIMCHYFKNNYIVFYNYGEEEIKNVYDLETSLRNRLKDGNKILVAVDNVHDKRTAAIFLIIDSLRSYEEKKDNIRFILTGRQPEFDRFVGDRLDTVSEPVRPSILNLYKKIIYTDLNFSQKEIQNFLERYNDEEDIRIFLINNNYDYNKLFVLKDPIALNNIASFIWEETNKGDPILLKFFIFGKGFAKDVGFRFFNYLKSERKLQSMLSCILLNRATIPISRDLIDKMNLMKSIDELTDETLTFSEDAFSEDADRWITIHPKWDLELLAYLYNITDNSILTKRKNSILTKRKNLLRKALELLMDNLSNENDKVSILATLYDSTTIDTEENRKFPITIVESIVNRKKNLIYNSSLSEHSIYNLYSFYISKNYYDSKLYDKSLAAVEEALKIYPNGTQAFVNKGIALSGLDRYEEAIKCYDEITTKLDPTNVNAWYNKGTILSKLGSYEEALKCFEITTKLDPTNVNAWYNKGTILGVLLRYEEALKCFDEITTKLDPKNVNAWLNKGNALGWSGRYEEALKCYDEITTKLDPTNVNALNNKGWALDKLSRYQEAIECYDKALQIDSNDKDALDGKGVALINLGKYEQAIEYFNKRLSIDPDYVNALELKKIAEEKMRNGSK